MVAGAFPLAKLGFIVVKQVSKPIANGIAARARKSRIFRDWICVPSAQLFHWYDVKIRMKVLNLGKVSNVPKLDEKKAIETGSQLLSEFILLVVASSVVIFEYRRSSEKEEVKQKLLEEEKEKLNEKVMNLELLAEQHSAKIRHLVRLNIAIRDDLQKLSGEKGVPSLPSALQLYDDRSGDDQDNRKSL